MPRKKVVKSTADTSLSNPQNRTEEFLAKIAGLSDSLPEGEFSRLERYLKVIASNTGGEMQASAYDPNGDVAQAGGIPAYVEGLYQKDLGFVEDTTYSGCFYRNITVGNQTEREWLNPPLSADTEYRTTERFLGKPVYIRCKALTSVSESVLRAYLTAENGTVDQIVDVGACAENGFKTTGINSNGGTQQFTIAAHSVENSSQVRVFLTRASGYTTDISTWTGYGWAKYTKNSTT